MIPYIFSRDPEELLFCHQYKKGTRDPEQFFRRIRSMDGKLFCLQYRKGERSLNEFYRRRRTPSVEEVTQRLIEKGLIK